jgi:hypothetical protein
MAMSFQEMVSAVARLRRREQQILDDPMNDYTGGACMDLIGRSLQREEEALVEASGWQREAFNAELIRRTSPKWAHFSGLSL